MKKLLFFVLFLVVAFGLIACTSTSENASEDATEADVLEVSMALAAGPGTPDAWIEEALEENLQENLGRPVNIESIFLPSSDQETRVNLLMSNLDSMPNVIWYQGSMRNEYDNWVENDVLIDMLPALQENGQNILNYYDKETLFYSYDRSGAMYRLPADVAEPSSMTTILRKDWMDTLGLEVPTTVDDYIDVLRAFTHDDPDGNGVDDTYGLSGPSEWRSFAPILYAHKSDPEHFLIQPDGTVKYGAVLPETREALLVLQGMYEEGLIDPRMVSDIDGDQFNEIMQAGNVGSFYRWVAWFNPADNNMQSFKANNPDGELMYIDPIVGPDGFSSDYPENLGGWSFISVTSPTEEPDEVVRVLDQIASPETFKLITFGEENEHYEIVDGEFQSLITPDESDQLGIGNFGWYISRKDEANIRNTPEVNDLFEQRAETSEPLRELKVFFKDSDRPAWNEYATDIETLRDQTFYGIISGSLSIEAFDQFVDEFYNIGGDEVEAEANELFQRQQEEFEEYEQWYDENILPYK